MVAVVGAFRSCFCCIKALSVGQLQSRGMDLFDSGDEPTGSGELTQKQLHEQWKRVSQRARLLARLARKPKRPQQESGPGDGVPGRKEPRKMVPPGEIVTAYPAAGEPNSCLEGHSVPLAPPFTSTALTVAGG